MMNVYADVDVFEQEDEGAESVSGCDVGQSPWYNADAITIAVSVTDGKWDWKQDWNRPAI